MAGLQSFSTSGQPGEDASVYIRGVGSVNASTTPLYVVDGIPYDGKLANINSQDIASVTVLKDAAAASLYGSRAANGVIMITTKQGQAGAAPSIELTAKYGFSSRAVADYDQLNMIIQVAQRDVIFRGLATTGNAGAQIGIVSILAHGILPAVIPKGVSASYQITVLSTVSLAAP